MRFIGPRLAVAGVLAASLALAGCATPGGADDGDGPLMLAVKPLALAAEGDGPQQYLLEAQIFTTGDAPLPESVAAGETVPGQPDGLVTFFDPASGMTDLRRLEGAQIVALPSVVTHEATDASIVVGSGAVHLPEDAAALPLDGYRLNMEPRAAENGAIEITLSFSECRRGNVIRGIEPRTVSVPIGRSVLFRALRAEE